MRRFLWLAALVAISARADYAIWTSSDVRITLERDGSLSVVETATAFLRDDVKEVDRWYWSSADEKVSVSRVVEILPNGTETEENLLSRSSVVRWKPSVTDTPQHTYRIESRVTGAVTPIWAPCCPVRQRGIYTSPIDRIQETIAMWRDFGAHRYILDYAFLFPDQQEGFGFAPTIAFGPEWKPLHPIRPGSLGAVFNAGTFGEPTGFRIRHIFEYTRAGKPAAVDAVTPLLRDLSVVAFPFLALAIWFGYLRRFIARPNIAQVDERWLNEHLFNEDAEVIAARWSGEPRTLGIASFLRRLERQGKVALDIGDLNSDDDFYVSVRLRVPRDQFSDFEKTVIDALIPKGNEIDSRDLQRTHAKQDFDPMKEAQERLYGLAHEGRAYQKTPAASRTLSFVLFITGFALVVYDSATRNPDPGIMLSPWALAVLTAVWPSRFIWRLVRRHRWAALLPFLPVFVFWALILWLQTGVAVPIGAVGSIGIVLAAIGAYHSIVADAAKSGGSQVERIVDLATAESWFREQLRQKRPVRKEWEPYVAAFGLTDEPEREEEDWGWALQTSAK